MAILRIPGQPKFMSRLIQRPDTRRHPARQEGSMNKERLQCIVSGLRRYELTKLEERFVHAVEEYFNENGILTEQQESILEGIYREKTRFFQDAILGMRQPRVDQKRS